MELKKAKKRFIEIANKTGIHGENLKQEPSMQEREELWDISRVFLNRIYTLDEIDNLFGEELNEYNDLCYWSIAALHWNDSLEEYTFDNGRHRRDTILLALCLYVRLDENYKLYEKIKENFVLPHAFGSILLWVFNDMTLVKTQDIYFNNYDIEFIKEADKQREAFFLKHGYYYRGDEELQQDKIEKIALEIHMILNRKGRKSLSQFLLQYITNDKGLLDVDGYSNVKYLTEKKGAKYNFNQSSEEKKGEYIKYESGISYQGEAKGEVDNRIPHGKGVMTVPDGPVITGDFKEGLADGYAKMDFLNGEVYEGEFKENKKHGKGVYVWPSGNDRQQYAGEFKNGLYEGEGIMTYYDGTKYEGSFKEDKRTGHGKLTYSDGASYKGYFENGEWEGGVDSYDEVNLTEEENAASYGRYTSTKNFTFYGLYNNDQQRTIHGTITTPDKVEINLKDCEKYKDKGLTDAYTSMKNTYGSHTFEYDDTDNGILSFERASEIFGNCTNEEELSFEIDRVYGLKINSLEGFVILHADDNEIKKALAEERDIESNVIIKSDNMKFIEILVEILKLNNRDKDSDNANKDILQFDAEFKEKETITENQKESQIQKIKSENEKPDFDRDLCSESLEDWVDALVGGEIQVLKISMNDLVEGKYDNLEEKGICDYGDKGALAKIISEKDMLIEEKEDKEYIEELKNDEGGVDYILNKVLLYCEGNYIWKLTDYEEVEENEKITDAHIEEVKKEASNEEVSPKEDVDNIQSFRNFMKEKFPSLKLPKNKSYAGIDLKNGYSINFHVQKKAVVLSFRSVKTDPQEIMRILNDKGLNGKDIGDGHVLKAEPGKRNPSIITMNIEIPYSSEEELASDELRENVRSYFEKFSELFNFNK